MAMLPEVSPRPSGVRYGVVAIATLAAVLLYLTRNCMAICKTPVCTSLGISEGDFAALGSAFFLSYALLQVPAGWLADRFGPRLMLTLYAFCWGLFTVLIAQTAEIARWLGSDSGLTLGRWSLVLVTIVVLRFFFGLAQAGAYPTSAGMLRHWVPLQSRGLASSIVSFGGRLGGVLAPLLTGYLLLSWNNNWQAILGCYGLASMAIALAYWFVVRDRPWQHPGCNAAEVALIVGDARNHSEPEAMTTPSTREPVPTEPFPLWGLLGNRSVWLLSLAQFCVNFGWVFVPHWFPTFLEDRSVDEKYRGLLASLPMAVGIVGMIAGGYATDTFTRRWGLAWGRRLPILIGTCIAAAAYISCALLPLTPVQTTLLLCLATFGTDFSVGAIWAFNQDVGERYVASVLGWGNMWGNIGAAVSIVALQWIKRTFHYEAVFLTCAAAFLGAGAMSFWVDANEKVRNPSP